MGVRALALLTLAGCDYITGSFVTNDFSGDPFPVHVESTSGAIVVGLAPDTGGIRTAVLDVSSPVTVFDPGPDAQPKITYPNVTLMGLDPTTPTSGALDQPRALFDSPQILSVHPCVTDQCFVGPVTQPRPIDAILGLNTFVSDALRLDLGLSELFVLPDVAGDNSNRGLACDAVLPQPYRGGGTMLVGGTEISFANWRVTIDTCLAPNPDPLILQSARGADVLMVVSTAVGVTILDETAYKRYREVVPSAPDVTALPDSSVLLPSGPIVGKLTTIPSLALVGNSTSNPRAPCRQMYSSFLMAFHDCVEGDDCPCTGTFPTFCPTPAVIMLTPPTPIDLLVVSDADPTIQSLRAELRPDQPEVDGIIGTNALAALELDLDVPHDRALGRCVDNTACSARPELSSQSRRKSVRQCIESPPGPILRVNR